jgi:mono/diheme cytochrome c family protein
MTSYGVALTSFRSNRSVGTTALRDRIASAFDRDDAPPFGLRKVITQAAHDLFGTKDVQNAITASYVWLADQLGHITLGLGPTLLVCWVISGLGAELGLQERTRQVAMVLATLGIFLVWVYKELQDIRVTRANAGDVFPFNESDIVWNVKTALVYFGAGGLLGLSVFLHWSLFLGAILLCLWPVTTVAYWWLKRKLAFQQAGLPYLYRLANFTGVFDRPAVEPARGMIAELCNLEHRPVLLWHVLTGRDLIDRSRPSQRHVLIAGPLRSGKTSLAVGIGTEFAFNLGIGRYMPAADLVELAAIKPAPNGQMEYDDGRILWPWNEVDLLIVDDLDAAVSAAAAADDKSTFARLVDPAQFVGAMRASGEAQPLDWLRDRRSVWVIGDPAGAEPWRDSIAALMGTAPEEITIMQMSVPPEEAAPVAAATSGRFRRLVGYAAGLVGALGLAASTAWWIGEGRWGAFQPLTPEQAFADGSFGLEIAPLKYMLVADRISATAFQQPQGPSWPSRFGFLARPDAVASRCAADAPRNLPVGFGVSNRLAGNATPVPVRFVGLTCAACHAAELGRAGVVLGAGSHTADIIAFSDAFLTAIQDPKLDGEAILAAYEAQCDADRPNPAARLIERLLIDQWLSGARAQARENASKYDLPFDSASLADPVHIPTGPSRTRPFRSVVRNALDLPGADNRAYSKVPVAALQALRPWSQFDGSVGDPVVRSMIAVFTSGASIAALNEPQIADNIEKAAQYTLRLGESPAWPRLWDAFPETPRADAATLAAGERIWTTHCATCHAAAPAGGVSITPVDQLGTDASRLRFRYAKMLPSALAGTLPQRETADQAKGLTDEREAALKAGDFAVADWFVRAGKRLEARAREYPAGHRRAFQPDQIAYRQGFLNAPIPFAWMRAPYLHNGSVPTLRALIGLEERPPIFCRGNAGYDPVAVGVKAPIPTDSGCPPTASFLFDTSQPGNSADGHRYPPPGSGVSRVELEALLAYLRTL